MKKVIVLMLALSAFILPFIGCKKTAAPTMPNPDGPMMTVTEIIKISDSARATQTYEAACTSTALAALFTHTSTMTITPTATITITATRTVTATVTCTATATLPVYIVYDPLIEAPAPDPAKWDAQIIGSESTIKVFPGMIELRAKTTVLGTDTITSITSKCPDGTKAFKGRIFYYGFSGAAISDYCMFTLETGNSQDGFTEKFYEYAAFHFEGSQINFEVKHVSGNNYTVSINGSTPENVVYAHQPQVRIKLSVHLTSNYIGATASGVYWAEDFYYY
ncbi:MAG TPA: hypothetical protein PLB12_11110 [Candidatus Goldiibacteriota bacterium]|nr:hypothetical protein [Candidatus Goldiibacteriota bacterium]